jgi:hypothetical protein
MSSSKYYTKFKILIYKMLDLHCLEKLSIKHPACARLLEGVVGAVLIEAIYYALSTQIEGVQFSWQGLIAAALLPLYMSLGKYRRGKTN